MIAHKGNFGPIVLKKSPKTGKAPIRFEIEIKNRTKTMRKIYPPADEMMIFDFFNTIGQFRTMGVWSDWTK